MRGLLQKAVWLVYVLLVLPIWANAQVTTAPEKINVLTSNVVITIDVSGTPVAGNDELYLWAWSSGVGDFATNGDWGASSDAAKLKKESDNVFSFTFPVTSGENTYNNLAEILGAADNPTAIKAVGGLVKTKDGGGKTDDLSIPIEPLSVSINVIKPLASDLFVEGDKIDIEASSPSSSQLTIKVNDTQVATKEGTSITYSIESVDAGDLKIEVSAAADGLTDTKTLNYVVGKTVEKAKRPEYATLLGPNYNGTEVTVVLQDPIAKKKFVNVIGSFNDWSDLSAYPMKLDEVDGVNYWWYTFTGLDADTEYIYQYLIDGVLKIADPYTEKVSDPDDKYINQGHTRYPNLIAYPEGKTDKRASVLQINQPTYEWQNNGFTPVPLAEAVVYELHVRDFVATDTYEEAMGKLDYIKDLGANTIHLMPVNEFEGNDSWGYNPNFYFAPDKYYGPKEKLMEFIDKAHGKGIAVVIDLVLNHSFHSSPMVRMYNKDGEYADPIKENPWFNEKSNFENEGLQWGADFDHESEFTQALVDSVNAHWMKYYHVDGFRFDFTKGFSNDIKGEDDFWGSKHDPARVKILTRMKDEIHARKSNAYVIFEHLSDNDEEVELANAGISLWGNMSHDFRDVVKGTNKDLKGQSPKDRGMPIHGLMSYMESHDEERIIYDSENYGTKSQAYDLKVLQNGIDREKLASAFFFMVPGPKLIWQFGEVGYNVSINQKEYQGEVSGDHRTSRKPLISEFDTQNDAIRQQLYDTYAALLKLRAEQGLSALDNDDYTFNLADEVKTISLNGTDIKVRMIGNFGLKPLEEHTYDFSADGDTWYSYFENGKTYTGSGTVNLNASEFIILVNKQVEYPAEGLVTGYMPMVEVTPYGFTEDQEIKVYFNPALSDKEFGTTISMTAGVVLDQHGSGNITNEKSMTMTKEGDKYVASFVPREFLELGAEAKPLELSLKFDDANSDVSEGPVFLDFEENNKKLYIVGDVLDVDWNPSNALEMQPDGEGGYVLEGVQLTEGQAFKFIAEREWNKGEWGYKAKNELQPTSGPGNDIPVEGTGKFTIRANINDLTYSIDNVTSIVDNEISKAVLAYPNPTSSLIKVFGESLVGNVTYQLRDNTGRVVKSGQEKVSNYELTLDLSRLSGGIYYVDISTSKGRVVKKVIRK
ncbi:alpha-amylase family glycosyl hydrolase [Flammeovirga aprica]|uniref:T9SS type A sorting domain-containing protein n=1 Tax=Flammeovirga aprica JL-4 TaxID=694437 RepID=A0A7X9P202_9BACT|nr:alpha-amylase family glycosyl hydrolase [Flammeovirga aprica]NME67723.1 T9SS type A sorting domain-containing protein [Flammeovirga aprica JL-4]